MKKKNNQILIQKQIDDAMADEFDKLLLSRKDDLLLQLLIT